jgi:hypothetical protein
VAESKMGVWAGVRQGRGGNVLSVKKGVIFPNHRRPLQNYSFFNTFLPCCGSEKLLLFQHVPTTPLSHAYPHTHFRLRQCPPPLLRRPHRGMGESRSRRLQAKDLPSHHHAAVPLAPVTQLQVLSRTFGRARGMRSTIGKAKLSARFQNRAVPSAGTWLIKFLKRRPLGTSAPSKLPSASRGLFCSSPCPRTQKLWPPSRSGWKSGRLGSSNR